MNWASILAYVTGTVEQELLARRALGEIGHRLGRKVLADVATISRPDTILGWYRELVARKFDGSKARRGTGRPRIKRSRCRRAART